jgi:hypothetical protein
MHSTPRGVRRRGWSPAGVAIVCGAALAAPACSSTDDADRPNVQVDAGASAPASFPCDPSTVADQPAPLRRLAKVYVTSSVREMFSQFADTPKAQILTDLQSRFDLIPTDDSAFYSQNDTTVSQDHVDAIFNLAVHAGALVSDATKPYGSEMLKVCGAGSTKATLADDVCLTKFAQYYGRKAFRRPLAQAEVDDFKAFYRSVVSAGMDGMAALVGRLFAHPNFYYRLDNAGDALDGAVFRLTPWELLSKITFLFWSAPPTDALYDRVAATDITKDENLSPLLDDILADPAAEQGVLGFYREWLTLDKTLIPGSAGNILADQALAMAAGVTLPPTHRDDMIQEVLDLSAHYSLRTNGRLDDILTSPYSFARTPALATIYGVPPWDGTKDHLVALPAGQRTGLLTRAAVVASNGEYTRPVIKGKFIRTRLLCTDIPPPPPGLNIKPLVQAPDHTTRQALDAVTQDPTCWGCHKSLNYLGYLSENYDPIGRFRDKEARFTDTSGQIVSELPVDTKAAPAISDGDTKELANAVELGQYLADSGKAHTCMVRNYFEFVTGRKESDTADGCTLEDLHQKLSAPGGSIKAMLKESAMQNTFRQRKAM